MAPRAAAGPGRAPAPIPAAEYQHRRRALVELAGDDAILVLPAAPERIRSHDTHHPYRQDSDFWYLTGFPEPEAVLVLVPGRPHGETLLFCRERHPERELWDGPRAGPEGAVDRFGIDDAYPIDDIDEILPGLLEGRSRVYYHFGRDKDFDLKLIGWVNRVRAQVRQGAEPPHEFLELGHLLHELRLAKSPAELRQLRHAAAIAAEAQKAAMRATRPGGHEYEVEAALWSVWRHHDAVAAYTPIVGAGPNACVLHYVANNAPLRDGDLLLCDAGAEYRGYASDITRSWPVNGRFSKEQRALYELVLAAQAAAISEARPGRPYAAVHDAAVRVLSEGLLSLGLLKGSLRKVLEAEAYKAFYMHKTGHWIGLDVHDVGDYKVAGESRVLEAGMVFTVEPGLYVAPSADVPAKWRGIGIRIEDEVLVAPGGPEVLTAAVPKAPDAVEAWMAG
ncbi:MAG: aminopeptidase P N-terminal domain-containing protein [Lysobacteraceae bacterium]